MAESSSDDDFCRVDSGSGDHDNVPRDTEFKVKIKYIPTVPKKKSKCFEYVLKKGIELPHFKELLGNKYVSFLGHFICHSFSLCHVKMFTALALCAAAI